MNLFALLRDTNRPLVRIPLSSPVQTELKILFAEQEASFRESAQSKIDFDGKYKPDSGECLTIKDYDDIDNIHYAIANAINIPEIEHSASEFDSIKALFAGKIESGKKIALIQSFDKRRVLSTKGYTIIDNIVNPAGAYKKVEGVGLTLDSRLAAILTDKELDFFSFFAVRQIFDMNHYYQLATDDDLKAFSGHAKVCINDFGEFLGVSDTWVRRKVILITQSGILEKLDTEKAKILAAAFNIVLNVEQRGGNNVIVLPSEKKDLKLVLKFLDEDYFHSLLTNTPSVSNSRRTV